MANPTHVHWLWHYHPETRWGETYCGYQGTYKAEFRFLMFEAFPQPERRRLQLDHRVLRGDVREVCSVPPVAHQDRGEGPEDGRGGVEYRPKVGSVAASVTR